MKLEISCIAYFITFAPAMEGKQGPFLKNIEYPSDLKKVNRFFCLQRESSVIIISRTLMK